jgi:hypothetical protein
MTGPFLISLRATVVKDEPVKGTPHFLTGFSLFKRECSGSRFFYEPGDTNLLPTIASLMASTKSALIRFLST